MRQPNPMILADLIREKAVRRPDFDVLTFEHLSLDDEATADEVRTYADLARNADRIAAGLVDHGMQPGDRFGLMLRNHPEYVETMIAASITGCVMVPIDPRTRGDKLAFLLHNAGCRGIVCGDYCLAQVRAVRGQCPDLAWTLALETGEGVPPATVAETPGASSLRAVLARPAAAMEIHLQSGADPLQIVYTSGTTGDPKGVVFPNDRFGAMAMLGVLAGYRPDDERPYTGLSLTHGNAQAVTLAPALMMELRAVFSRRFTKSRLWDVCRRHGCTVFSLLGGMATAIYSEPLRADDADNPVRFVTSAGMPAGIWEAFEKRFDVRILEWYAAVEGGMAIKPIGEGPIGSFGKPVPGMEMKILDANDNECPPGVMGEISSRPMGATASVEYYGNREASAEKTRGGWLRSGDIGHTDAEGWFFFDFRKGGGIRHNGDFINPGFVEKAIAEHPSVSDVFVYGVPAASGAPGEKDVVAAVVPVDRAAFDAAALLAACRHSLEANFVPSYIQVVDDIPKTASEKPQERFLFESFAPDAPNVFRERSAA
ncbi:MAG TPA: AMP-binding protein [Candidatus Dormibacteraeota bacterium]|nr:AMP-binding protein [Candidatus Dormibacteraeota bacterium]